MATKKKQKAWVAPLVFALVIILIAGLIVVDRLDSNGTILRSKTVLKSDNFSVSGTVMEFAVMTTYQNFATQNQSYLQLFGLDTSKSLSSQKYGDGTWLDFFKESTETVLSQYLVYAEAAKADGMELSDEELANIDRTIESMKTVAKNYGYQNLNAYLASAYGIGVKAKDVKEFYKLATLANDYQSKIYKEIEDAVTDEDIANEYKENPNDYSFVDLISYSDSISIANDLSDAEKETLKGSLMSKFNAIAAGTDAEGIKSGIREYLEEKNMTASLTDSADTVDVEEELAKIEETLSYGGIKPTDAADWVFENIDGVYARNNGDVKVFEQYTEGGEATDSDEAKPDTYTVSIFFVAKAPYANDKATKNVGHILVRSDSYASDDEAKAKAEEILAEYKAGEMTKEAFETLGEKYTEDSNVFYYNVKEGQMVTEFNDWLFDSSRQVGDVEIVKTKSYGYHIMYFDGEGERKEWQVDCASKVVNTKSSAKSEELTKTYNVEKNESAMKAVKGK